jgi:hypothetical protein
MEMSSNMKAGTLLALTFVVGAITGVLGGGAWRQSRDFRPPPREDQRGGQGQGRGGQRGFVEQTLRMLEPSDSAQEAALRPLLQHTDDQNRLIVTGARETMNAELDSLRVRIAPLLDAGQLERYDEFRQRSQQQPGVGRDGRGPRGRGRRGGGPPDDPFRPGPPPGGDGRGRGGPPPL